MYFAIARKCFLSQSVLSLTYGNGCIISWLVAADSYTHACVNPSTVPLGVLQPHSLIFFFFVVGSFTSCLFLKNIVFYSNSGPNINSIIFYEAGAMCDDNERALCKV